MKRLIFAIFTMALAQAQSPLAGRWDINVSAGNETYPDWMEVIVKNGQPSVRVQPRSGSVHWVTNVKLDGSSLTFTLNRAGKKAPEVTWEVTSAGNDRITGTQKAGGVENAKLEGVRAPALNRPMPKSWGAPEPIFSGKDLAGWEPIQGTNHWAAQNGELVNVERGANLKTTRKFNDFKLHIELNCPDGGNSGIYLRGRYEIQVAYESGPDSYHSMGAIYGMLAPSREMPRKPGQWEAFDATLVGRTITLVRDGVTILDRQQIPGITGGALDANEAEPGPFFLQGDHTGGMKYRNITISEPK